MIYTEFNIFLAFILIGLIIGFLFDFFRILRRTYKTPDFITIIEDIVFWLVSYQFSQKKVNDYVGSHRKTHKTNVIL